MSLSFLIFWKCALRRSKIVNIIYQKLTSCIILPFYQNHKRAWNKFWVSTIGWKTNLRCFSCCTNTWPNIILKTLFPSYKKIHSLYINSYYTAKHIFRIFTCAHQGVRNARFCFCRHIVWACLITLWGRRLKG